MRSDLPDLRYELKLAGIEELVPRLRMALRMDRAGIRTLYPTRMVQSIYLDTPAQRALEENLAGLSERRKVRLRWYGEGTERVDAHLELKARANSQGWKDILPLPGAMQIAGTPRHAFMAELERRAPPLWRARLAGLEPSQWVRYWRDYLTSADQRVRLTIDRELAWFDQRRLARLSDRERTPGLRLVVLEVKCAPEDLPRAQEIVGRMPIPLGRCSKFVLAGSPESGPLLSDDED